MDEPEKQKTAEIPKKTGLFRLRTDLLSPAEAKQECFRRLTNALPDLPALAVVIVMGGIGAALACWWHLSIGEKEFASDVSNLSVWLRICLGSLGATAAVFFLAKTDTSKLIHCGLIAALSGMAGPYLVTKALSSVVSVNSNLVNVGSPISVVKSSTETLNKALDAQTTDSNPQKIIEAFDQTAQAASSYLNVLKTAPKNSKDRELADTKQQLQQTLKVLSAAAAVVPKQSVPLLTKVASEAQEAGAPEVAQEAQKILDTNSAVRAAVETAAQSGKVYFITPEELTDAALHDLYLRIKTRFPLADIQPAVHPARKMEPGLEFVYYQDVAAGKQLAEALSQVVDGYLKDHKVAPTKPRVRKGTTDQTPVPLQFDIHIGPDVASSLVSNLAK